MDVKVNIQNAVIRIYRGGDRKYWKYQDRDVTALYFNVQASRYLMEENGREAVRVCYEFTSDSEEELNDIASHGENSRWDLKGRVRDVKVVDGHGRDGKPEQRVFIKLADVMIRPRESGDMDKIHRYHVVTPE